MYVQGRNVFLVGQVSGLVENFNTGIPSDTINVIKSNFVCRYYTLSIICSIHIQWPWHYFRVTAVSTSFYWKFNVLIRLSWKFVWLLSTSHLIMLKLHDCWEHLAGHENATIFVVFHTYAREITDVFPNSTETLLLAFLGTLFNQGFKFEYYNLAWGLPINFRFDQLELVSRSQVCQNHKLAIVFLFTVV